MLDPDSVALLEGGCALIVGTVAADGTPHATRGWGLTVLDRDPIRIRLVISAEEQALANLDATGRLAVTAADVPTLRSLQLKGRVAAVEPMTDADRDTVGRYTDAMFTDIERTDGAPRLVLERWRALAHVVCEVEVDEWFDQTPGPGAGAPLVRRP
ncbi:MAG TPA: pyridoxamine 5'-phosphate oxidase family protein [Acidimicrobiales bacterium]|nr:pyridoxamine 5'-phosphate oxidase family protein [Acidimicrobiales bacterium]